MNILDKPDQDPQVANTEPIVAELTGEDSFLWVDEDNLNLAAQLDQMATIQSN